MGGAETVAPVASRVVRLVGPASRQPCAGRLAVTRSSRAALRHARETDAPVAPVTQVVLQRTQEGAIRI